jgi:hypothetical protein
MHLLFIRCEMIDEVKLCFFSVNWICYIYANFRCYFYYKFTDASYYIKFPHLHIYVIFYISLHIFSMMKLKLLSFSTFCRKICSISNAICYSIYSINILKKTTETTKHILLCVLYLKHQKNKCSMLYEEIKTRNPGLCII